MRKEYKIAKKGSSKNDTDLYPIWIHLMYLWIDAVGKVAEEIMMQDAGNAPKQLYVNILFAEYFVDIGAGAA